MNCNISTAMIKIKTKNCSKNCNVGYNQSGISAWNLTPNCFLLLLLGFKRLRFFGLTSEASFFIPCKTYFTYPGTALSSLNFWISSIFCDFFLSSSICHSFASKSCLRNIFRMTRKSWRDSSRQIVLSTLKLHAISSPSPIFSSIYIRAH